MIWFFTRGAAQLDIEVRRVPHTGAWELIVDYPDGTETVERITNPRKLVNRTLTVQRRLIRDGWAPTGPAGTGLRTQRMKRSRGGRLQHLRTIAQTIAHVQRDVTRRLTAAFGL
jgi:hypothetical protein